MRMACAWQGYSAGSTIKSTSASAVLGSRASAATNSFVLEGLFRSVQLIPVRRPHTSDEVVANLGSHPSNELSKEYITDTGSLREATLAGLLPAHHCRLQNRSTIPLFPKRCGVEPWTGPELVEALQAWLR